MVCTFWPSLFTALNTFLHRSFSTLAWFQPLVFRRYNSPSVHSLGRDMVVLGPASLYPRPFMRFGTANGPVA